MHLKNKDPKLHKILNNELARQQQKLEMIPSENFTSSAVREALGSVMSHKYSEGQIGKRYYEGNKFIDETEALCKERALATFHLEKTWHVNVQAYAGSIANLAVLNALLSPGDKIMAMYLYDGGHLSHGWKYKNAKITLSSKLYKVCYYHVNPKTEQLDYDQIDRQAQKEKPQILISGGTAYPREIDHKKLSQVARKVNAFYLADIAHEAGLVAAEVNKSPFPYADIVTMTTHKTLRGPKGAMIFCQKEFARQIDRSVFPGLQGGPMNNNIAAIAVCLREAQSRKFRLYANQVVFNAAKLASELESFGFKLITNGTDKHLILIDLRNKKISGKFAARALHIAGITLNKNTIPAETNTPSNPSGIRLGTPFITTRGMKAKEMISIARWIDEVIELTRPFANLEFSVFQNKVRNMNKITNIREHIKKLCSTYPLPK